jgi:cytoskeletal protein CcmA (bactofilin family)
MFSGKNKKESSIEQAAGSQTSIGAGAVITGDINTAGDLRIDGTLNGNIHCNGRVLIGPEGVVNGDIESIHADILGQVKGKLQVQELLHLRGKGLIGGDVHAGRFQMEPTATFNGQCHTGGNLVSMKAAVEEPLAVHQL